MDRAAFEQLYDAHAAPLVGFLVYRTGDEALAEDLAADTFERVLRARRPYDPRKGSERTWLFTIALNTLRDHLRRRGAEKRALAAAPAENGVVEAGSDLVARRDELARALQTLGPKEREAVALRYGADLPVAEISRVTGDKPATVEKRLQRALERLRGYLAASQADGGVLTMRGAGTPYRDASRGERP